MKTKTLFTIPFTIGCFATLIAVSQFGCATPTVTPAQPAITNAVTGVVTLPVPASTNYAPNATVGQIVATGTAVSAVLPQPYGGLVTGLLALLTLGASTVAAYKNKQLNTVQAVQNTIIQGVEAAGTVAAAVKQSIAKTAAANGTADAVETAVNNITGSQ